LRMKTPFFQTKGAGARVVELLRRPRANIFNRP